MSVRKRNGATESVSFDKILARIRCLGTGLAIDPAYVALKTIHSLTPNIETSKLDDIASDIAATNCWYHSDYGVLAGRIAVSNLIKSTPGCFSGAMLAAASMLNDDFVQYVKRNAAFLDALVREHEQADFNYSFLAVTTMKRTYLLRCPDTQAVLELSIFAIQYSAMVVSCS